MVLGSFQTNEQRILERIARDIGEPVTIKIDGYYPEGTRVVFKFPDNWRIEMDIPENVEDLLNDNIYEGFITTVKYIRTDQLKGTGNTPTQS